MSGHYASLDSRLIQRRRGSWYHPRYIRIYVSRLKEAELGYSLPSLTFLPTINTRPSADQDSVNASPPTSRRLTQVLERTSQKRTVPSVEQLASSDSRTGLNVTFSTPAEWPRRSVEYLTAGRSGFQMRRVRSADPVAINWPVGFHARVRMLYEEGNHQLRIGIGRKASVTNV